MRNLIGTLYVLASIIYFSFDTSASPPDSVREDFLFFEYHGSAKSVHLMSPLSRWEASDDFVFQKVSKDHFVFSMRVPHLDRLEYKLLVDGRWMSDPENPLKTDSGNSVVHFPIRPHRLTLPPPDEIALETRTFTVDGFDITVVHPTEFKNTSTFYFNDGGDYLKVAGLNNALGNLALMGHPITAVFIKPKNRMSDYAMSDTYSQFQVSKILPFVEQRFSTGKNKEKRFLVGASLGGLQATYTAFRFKDFFGGLISQSGSFWWEDGKILSWLKERTNSNIKAWISVGEFETKAMKYYNRSVFEILEKDTGESSAIYSEGPGVHDWSLWGPDLFDAWENWVIQNSSSELTPSCLRALQTRQKI
jgi:hypothetical protein